LFNASEFETKSCKNVYDLMDPAKPHRMVLKVMIATIKINVEDICKKQDD